MSHLTAASHVCEMGNKALHCCILDSSTQNVRQHHNANAQCYLLSSRRDADVAQMQIQKIIEDEHPL